MKRLVVLLCLVIGLPLASAQAARAAVAFKPCAGASGRGLECGTLAVPLDRSGKVPGTLSLAVRRVVGSAGTEVVLRLGGGPGEASTPALAGFARQFRAQLAGRQVVAIDTRGTGAGGIRCSETGSAARCAKAVGARLPFLNTASTVEDLDQLRQELGATKLSIVATSYGGKVANEYARRHPASTGFLVLDSPTPLAGTDPFFRDRAAALPRVLSDVCAGGGCRNITPSLRGDVTAVVAQARRGALRAPIAGRSRRIGVAALYGLIATSDLAPYGRAVLPAAFRAARQGDPALLGRLLTLNATSGEDVVADPSLLSTGTLLAVTCQESAFPWDPASAPGAGRVATLRTAVKTLPVASYAPFGVDVALASSTLAPCATWPSVPASPPTTEPAPSTVPVLTLVGTQDLRTPVEPARQLTGEYALGQVVEVPGAGHAPLGSDPTTCAATAVRSFLAAPTAPAQQCSTATRIPAPFVAPPRTVGAAAPIRGVPGATGAVTSATLASLDDLIEAIVTGGRDRIAIRGLRGGTATVRAPRMTLTGYSAVRGLRLSGTLRLTSGTLAVAGTLRVTSSTGSGTLRIAGRRVSGTIAGRQLTVRRVLSSPLEASAIGLQ